MFYSSLYPLYTLYTLFTPYTLYTLYTLYTPYTLYTLYTLYTPYKYMYSFCAFSIEFDRDGDYFAIAGVTKKIKV